MHDNDDQDREVIKDLEPRDDDGDAGSAEAVDEPLREASDGPRSEA